MDLRNTGLCVLTLALASCVQGQDAPAPTAVVVANPARCYAAASNGSHFALHLREREYTLLRDQAGHRVGEQYGFWKSAGDTIRLGGEFADIASMPAIPRDWSKDGAGRLVSAAKDSTWTFAPAECAPLIATSYETPMATLQIPAGAEVTFREDTRDFGRNEPGMYVTINDPAGTAVLLFSVVYAPVDAPPMDLRSEAVGNTALGERGFFSMLKAKDVEIDGVPAARYASQRRALNVDVRSVGYAMERNGCQVRISIESTAPDASMFKALDAASMQIRWKNYRCVRTTSS
jgi:hypothetical protein